MYVRSNIPYINRMTPPNCLYFDIVKTMIAINQLNTDLSEVNTLPLDLAISNDQNALWNDFETKFWNFAVKNSRIRQHRVKSEYKLYLAIS